VICNDRNVGTARAINQGWLNRLPQEHAVKIDSDMVVTDRDWCDRLEDCVERDHGIGVCGLKRKDCIEAPWVEGWYHSELQMLPHRPGERWLVVENAEHVMGSCVLHSWRLLEKIGYLWQAGFLWGFDDSILAARCKVAGFRSCFYPAVGCDHIDLGESRYQKEKEASAARNFPRYHQILREYAAGTRSIYNGPNDD
jgi:GT2 family glycosyltransferase